MLVQLQPMQVSLMWENVRQSVLKSSNVPPELEASYSSKLLKNLLSGKFQCWIVYTKHEDERQIVAIGITSIIQDNLFDVKNLHILNLYGLRTLDEQTATDAFEKLRKYAKANQCENVTMTTSVPRVEELASLQGFKRESSNFKVAI